MPTVLAKNMSEKNEEISFEVAFEEIIYEGLERQGLILPHGCLAGSCGACCIEILEGLENLKAPSAVEADTIEHILKSNRKINNSARHIRLSCRAKVTGNITITKIR